MEFLLAQGVSPIQTLIGRRASKTLTIEVLLNHFRDHRPSDQWIQEQVENRKFTDRRPGRPKGAQDKYPRATGLDRQRAPKAAVEGQFINGLLDAMIVGNAKRVVALRDMALRRNLNWDFIESEARNDFDLNYGGNKNSGSISGSSGSDDQGAAPTTGEKVQMPWEW